MSYLSVPASTTEYGVVEVGDFINVLDGVNCVYRASKWWII